MIRGYTDHAANERTFLAWVRTGIAVIAFGFVIEKFNLFVLTIASSTSAEVAHRLQLESLSGPLGRYVGHALIFGGFALIVVATARFVRTGRLLDDPEMHSARSVRAEPIFSVVLVLLVAGFSTYLWSRYDGAVHYVTEKVERGSIVRTVSATGVVNPANTAPVGTHVSGVIQALYCDVKTKVKAGQLCAKIDPRPYQAPVDQEKANLAEAEARLEKDKAALTHAEAIFERNQIRAQRRAISRAALDKSRNAYERARARAMPDEASIAERQAALHAAEINLGNTDIVSPVDGTVISRNVEVGQTAAAGSEVRLFLVAADLTLMHVDANVREKDISEVKRGDKATFTVESFPNHPFTGEVTRISQSPRKIENIMTYDVVISAPNPDLLLEPGMATAITIVVDRRDDALRAPDQAMRYSPDRPAALRVGAGPRTPPDASSQVWILRDGKSTAVSVRLGLDDGAYTEVVWGDLQPGDQAIVGEGMDASEKTTAKLR